MAFQSKYFLLTRGHEEAASNLRYGISTGNGITLLLGDPGTGKTSVIRQVLGEQPDTSGFSAHAVYVTNPTLTTREFVDTLAHGFQLSPSAAASKSRFLRELESRLIQRRAAGTISVLMIDEAQSLSDALLEEVRLLANMEADGRKVLQIVLAGQSALGERLRAPGLQQLKQRIGLRCVLPSLNLEDTARYIARRISVAGGSPAMIFTRDAVVAIYQRSRGVPRVINVVSDNALLTGFAVGQRPVDEQTVHEVCSDFDLLDPPPATLSFQEPASVPRAVEEPPIPRGRFSLPHLLARRR